MEGVGEEGDALGYLEDGEGVDLILRGLGGRVEG